MRRELLLRETDAMRAIDTVSSEEWRAALAGLRAEEKALTKTHDALAAKRRRMRASG